MNKSVRKFVFLNILAFLFYYCSGRLSLNLSSLDGYSTPIWPPAGIALALILIFGKKVWFGLFIGAFFCNTNSVTFENGFYKFIIFNFHNLIVAFGNSIQALIAACFLKRFAKFPNSLCSQNEILSFFFYAGPIACFCASVIGTITLLLKNIISKNEFLFSWFTWWLGDTIGVIIFTPILFILWNSFKRKESISRTIIVFIGFCITFICTITIFLITKNWERSDLYTQLKNDTLNIGSSIEISLEENIRTLKILSNFISLSPNLDHLKFERFADGIIRDSKSVIALSWNPYISNKEREIYEKKLNATYPTQKWISTRNNKGELIKSPEEKEYVFVQYVVPFSSNKAAVGYNIWSNLTRQKALKKAMRENKTQITERIKLVQETNDSYGVLIFHPVRTVNKILGFSTAVIQIPSLIEEALKGIAFDKLCLKLQDTSAQENLIELNCNNSIVNLKKEFTENYKILGITREWEVQIIPTEEYVRTYIGKSSYIVLLISSLITGLFGILILIITGREIATQKVVEEKTHQLKESNRVKSEFLANMSHEIRTPMNGVLGMLYLLEKTPLNLEQSDYVSNAKHSIVSLLGIINDILDVSKLEKNKLEIKPYNLELFRFMNEIDSLFRIEADKKKLSLNVTLPKDDIPFFVDGDRLRQILINLIGNAFKFTFEGSISVIVSKEIIDKPYLKFIIKDTGVGISEADQDKIFDRFIQVENSRNKKFEGSGLGLYICKQLLTLMDGSISLESQLGLGSSFTFFIPLKEIIIPAPPSDPGNLKKSSGKKLIHKQLNILVAEDNKVNQMFIKKILEKNQHIVTLALNGKKVIEILEEYEKENQKYFHLILMDIQMPEMDGLTATKLIRENPFHKDLPIVALTANSMKSQIEEYLASGMDDCTTKPIIPEKLFLTIANLLNVPLETIFNDKV